MPAAPKIFDRRLVRARRSRAFSRGASPPDFLLARVAEDFRDRVSVIQRQFPLAANVGAFNGLVSCGLRTLPNVGDVIDVDASPACLDHCASPKVGADEEALPFADESLDLVVSALALHTVNDLPGALIQIRRALKPDGLFLGALLGGETLGELREAWLAAESDLLGGASPRVAPFADVRDLGGLLQRAGFALPVADSDVVRVTYPNPLALMHDIKAMGASNALSERRRTPVTRRLLLRAAEIYQQRFGLENGRVPATFEIVTLTGWVPHPSQQKPLRPGSAKMSLADALKPKPDNL